jgi:hypothetical protein
MKAPVWFLLARLDFAGGSTGYHRAMLIDQAIQRFGDWWLIGARDNDSWGVGLDMWDVQNEFLAQGMTAGLLGLILFVLLVSRTFRLVGAARKSACSDRRQQWLIWACGAVVTAHVSAFIGSDYFDQTRFWWFTTLAIIIASTLPTSAGKYARPGLVPTRSIEPIMAPAPAGIER